MLFKKIMSETERFFYHYYRHHVSPSLLELSPNP